MCDGATNMTHEREALIAATAKRHELDVSLFQKTIDAYESGPEDEWSPFSLSALAKAVAAGVERHERLVAVRAAAQAVVDKLDEIHENTEYKSVWTLYRIHGRKYDGPTYEVELATLRTTLEGSA